MHGADLCVVSIYQPLSHLPDSQLLTRGEKSANRIIVQKSIAQKFTALLVQKVEALIVGPGLNPSTTQGPLVNASGVEKVKTHVADALSKGAKIETGGSAPDHAGYFYKPTVLSGVTTDMLVANDETFGPLAPIFSFETEAEAVKLANETEFGLAGYFFSKDIGRVMRVARKLECGMVGVNTGKISAAEAPFGGKLSFLMWRLFVGMELC